MTFRTKLNSYFAYIYYIAHKIKPRCKYTLIYITIAIVLFEVN